MDKGFVLLTKALPISKYVCGHNNCLGADVSWHLGCLPSLPALCEEIVHADSVQAFALQRNDRAFL